MLRKESLYCWREREGDGVRKKEGGFVKREKLRYAEKKGTNERERE